MQAMTKLKSNECPRPRTVEEAYAAYLSERSLAITDTVPTNQVSEASWPHHSLSPNETAGEDGQDLRRMVTKPSHDLTARQWRVLKALYRNRVQGDQGVSRERLDDIAGASNSPQIVSELRRKLLGKDGLLCRKVDVVDRDGKTCKAGRYFLSEEGFALVRKLQEGQHVV
jgi:hypothetical protein